MQNQTQISDKGRWIDTITLAGSVRIDDKQAIEDTGRMLVYLPAGYASGDSLPLVIILHGWGQKPEDWRASTGISPLADKYRVVVAAPAMGKTVYEFQYYAETRTKWNKVPGARWIGEVVLPYMRKNFSVSTRQSHTALIGVSTGGRGAVVVSERYPEFGFAASVSGTYDLGILGKKEGEYKIHADVFGSRDSFPDRWKDEDCRNAKSVDALKGMTLFISHGKKDPVVNISQMESFRKFLDAGKITCQANISENSGHDWKFWDSQLPIIFDLMNKSMKNDSQ